MPTYEDFTGYTKVDPNSKITTTTTRATIASGVSASTYLYKDYGAAHFVGSLRHNYDWINLANDNKSTGFWCLANDLFDIQASFQNNKTAVLSDMYNSSPNIPEIYEYVTGAGPSSDTYTVSAGTLTFNTTYYGQVWYDSTDGAHGKFHHYTYPTATDRTNGTNVTYHKSLALHVTLSFRYLIAISSYGTGSYNGYIENLDLSAPAPPVAGNASFLLKMAV